jgi:hypothetical protein
MGATLAKERTILQFRLEDRLRGQVTFRQEDIEGERSIRSFVIAGELWRELGQPQILTVSIEPGDLLNAEE